jgi:hypothetical protein
MSKVSRGYFVIAGALSMVLGLAGAALATVPGPTNITSSVTPFFEGLITQATDLIPYALGVIGVGLAFRMVVGWLRHSH